MLGLVHNPLATVTPKTRTRRASAEQLYLKGKQIEQVFGLPYRTVYDLYVRGQLPAVRLNRSLWFSRSDIEALLERNREVCA
jgi:predicted DNA-binding transcriptional regulator AlpA